MWKKLQREISEPLSPGPAGNPEEDCYSDLEWSEVEEDLGFPIAHPVEGWRTAEREYEALLERFRSTQSYHKKQHEFGGRGSLLRTVYSFHGDISQFFRGEGLRPREDCVDHLLTFTLSLITTVVSEGV